MHDFIPNFSVGRSSSSGQKTRKLKKVRMVHKERLNSEELVSC